MKIFPIQLTQYHGNPYNSCVWNPWHCTESFPYSILHYLCPRPRPGSLANADCVVQPANWAAPTSLDRLPFIVQYSFGKPTVFWLVLIFECARPPPANQTPTLSSCLAHVSSPALAVKSPRTFCNVPNTLTLVLHKHKEWCLFCYTSHFSDCQPASALRLSRM